MIRKITGNFEKKTPADWLNLA